MYMDSYSGFMQRQKERMQRDRSAQEAESAAERGRRLRVAGSTEPAPPAEEHLVIRGKATEESTREGLKRDMEDQRTKVKFDLLRAELAVAFKKEKNPKRLVELAMSRMTPAESLSLPSMRPWQIEVFASQLAASTHEQDEARLERISSLVKKAFEPEDAGQQMTGK